MMEYVLLTKPGLLSQQGPQLSEAVEKVKALQTLTQLPPHRHRCPAKRVPNRLRLAKRPLCVPVLQGAMWHCHLQADMESRQAVGANYMIGHRINTELKSYASKLEVSWAQQH